MSSQIMPAEGSTTPPGQTESPSAACTHAVADAFGSGLGASLGTPWGQLQTGPPAEVLDQIEAAGRISRRLGESGYEVRFRGVVAGATTVELCDPRGQVVKRMSIVEAFELAAGCGQE